jgi:thymidylate kinase
MTSGLLFNTFEGFLQKATDAGIPFAQIRERELSEQVALSDGDYDYFVADDSIEVFLSMLHTEAAASCLPLLICRQKREKAKVTIFSPDGRDRILLDLWIRLEVKDPSRRTRRYLFSRDVVPHLEARGGITRLRPDVEAIYYASHLYTKKKDLAAPGVQVRLAHYAEATEGSPEVAALLRALIGGGAAKDAALAANDLLLQMGLLHPKFKGPSLAEDLNTLVEDRIHKFKRKLVAKRKYIAVVGPDGVGKTTLIGAATSCLAQGGRYFRFKKLYRQAVLYKLLHRSLRKKHNLLANTKLEKNQIDDRTGMLVFWLAWSRSYLLALRNLRASFTLVDRYYFELLIRDLRFTELLPTLRPTWCSMLRHIPSPRLVLHLDAPNDVIAARNDELRSEGVDFYRAQMFALAQLRGVPFYLYLNTSNSVDDCKVVICEALHEMRIPTSRETAIEVQP